MEFHNNGEMRGQVAKRSCMHAQFVVCCCCRAGNQENDRAPLTFEYVYNTIWNAISSAACVFI